MRSVREILRHSSVYAVGQILSRVASLLLLPLYTRMLTPADYGCVAILDLTAGLLAVVLGAGMSSAVTRFHFDATTAEERRRVWWTGLLYLLGASMVVVTPAWLGRDWLASVTLGPSVTDGPAYYQLALLTLCVGTFAEVFDAWLRVRKWSGIYIVLSLFRLLVNVGLNVYFLVVLRWGIQGLLTGNLIATLVNTLVMFVLFLRHEGRAAFDITVARRLLGFGTPLIATAVLSMVIHEADRYFLRTWVSLDEVGVYSLAYKVGQAVNMLCLVPFSAIWGVVVYEIARQPDARRQYADIFEQFVAGLSLVMLGAALFARPVLGLLASSDYSDAADLVPVICLACLCFSLHEHFRVPVMLSRATLSLIPVSLFAALVNVAANLCLIPIWQAHGAAWASVITYSAYSFGGLWCYRRIDAYPYSFRRSAETVAGMVLTWGACRMAWDISIVAGWSLCICAWTGWAIVLFGSHALQLLRTRQFRRTIAVSADAPMQH